MTEEEAQAKTKTAEDYQAAVEAVIDVADLVISFVPGASQAKAVAKVLTHAKAVKKAAPQIGRAAQMAQPALAKMADAAPDAAQKAGAAIGDAAASAAGAVGAVAKRAFDPIGDALDARKEAQAQAEARRVLLEGAGVRMSVERFRENKVSHEFASTGEGYLGYPGCYAFAVYDHAPKEKGFGRYRAIYIGKSDDIGRSIADDLAGRGNVDVYADAKYEQDALLFLFPCQEENLERLHQSLIVALDADESYNQEK